MKKKSVETMALQSYSLNCQEPQKTREEPHKIFYKWGFKITIDAGLIQTDILDIELNLPNRIIIPFRKPNSDILYVSNQSNHPNQILKQLPITINVRLYKLSSSQESFNRLKHNYQSALKPANYKFNLTFQKSNKIKKERKKKLFESIFFTNCSH